MRTKADSVERQNLGQVCTQSNSENRADLIELKVLPTQPDHPAIPEEEGDDEDAHERVKADDESEGVEVSPCLVR
jgi:hypothetical protein